jgi:hypothetical protein
MPLRERSCLLLRIIPSAWTVQVKGTQVLALSMAITISLPECGKNPHPHPFSKNAVLAFLEKGDF